MGRNVIQRRMRTMLLVTVQYFGHRSTPAADVASSAFRNWFRPCKRCGSHEFRNRPVMNQKWCFPARRSRLGSGDRGATRERKIDSDESTSFHVEDAKSLTAKA